MIEIKFCENNFSFGVDELIDRIKDEFDNVLIEVEPCLGYCAECATGPFALVNDELVQADTVEELYEKIKEKLEK